MVLQDVIYTETDEGLFTGFVRADLRWNGVAHMGARFYRDGCFLRLHPPCRCLLLLRLLQHQVRLCDIVSVLLQPFRRSFSCKGRFLAHEIHEVVDMEDISTGKDTSKARLHTLVDQGTAGDR